MAPRVEAPRLHSGLEEMEMQERLSLDERGQEERLLSSGHECQDEGDGKLEYKVEWQLRTGWAIVGSILAAVGVFIIMTLFTRYYVVGDVKESPPVEEVPSYDFRRHPSDYVLDPSWDFEAARTVREFKWTILDRIANPDGVYRPMLTINGKFPGPMIECNEGDTLLIEVENLSINATSIHFHGIFQNGTNWMDGTTGITQCPIAPGGRFRYEFIVSGQSGTYFYHGHQAVQMADGLFGPLVIYSRNEKSYQRIPYVTDRVVMLQDYYHELSHSLLISSLKPGSEASPIPNAALINGLNTYNCSKSPGKLCDDITSKLPVFDLARNRNHRLRFLNVGVFAWFEVSLDAHPLSITEVDGTDVEPLTTRQMQIGPAQRYSIIITTNQTSRDSFWLRARMITHCFSNPDLPGPGADTVNAIVNYSKEYKSTRFISPPTSQNWGNGFAVQCRDMNHTAFRPIPAIVAPATADHSYYIRSNLEIGDWRLERGFFNTSTFRPNLPSPSLHRTLEGLQSANSTFNAIINGVNDITFLLKNELVLQHTGIQTVDLIIQNFDEGSHPMHLHGHKFFVLGQGHGYFPGYSNLQPNLGSSLGFENPIRRDTATVEGFGWLLLRFVADNPGMWAFHCHMAWHSEAGMVMQFLSRPEIMAGWELPAQHRQLCEVDTADLEKGAAPKDEIWYGFGIGE